MKGAVVVAAGSLALASPTLRQQTPTATRNLLWKVGGRRHEVGRGAARDLDDDHGEREGLDEQGAPDEGILQRVRLEARRRRHEHAQHGRRERDDEGHFRVVALVPLEEPLVVCFGCGDGLVHCHDGRQLVATMGRR